ncbi:thyroid transcription factor 1-associated protein 26 [Pelodytes ibericus]
MAAPGVFGIRSAGRNRGARGRKDSRREHQETLGRDGPGKALGKRWRGGSFGPGFRGRGGVRLQDRGEITGATSEKSGSPGHVGQNPKKIKRKWVQPQEKVFQGSAKEGHGFALWRKQKVQLEYKKLLRKQKKTNVTKEVVYTDNYPEHLKHLYLAEEEFLKKQEKRRRPEDAAAQVAEEDVPEIPKKKFKKKTSNQKAKEEYERVQQERARKREEAEKRRKEREEAQKLYKKKKMESYKILSTKTKKGQPNFNLQMEYLLQKIQQES